MDTPNKSAWENYRRWSKFTWFILPVGIGIQFFPAGFVPLLIYGLYCSFRIQFFDCPSCEEPFFLSPKFPRIYWPWASRCMNCGFPKWEEPPPKPPKANLYPPPRDENPTRDPGIAERLRLVKFLTLVLRDDPKAIGLRLDENGWADLENLVTRAKRHGIKLTRENLPEVLAVSETIHFEWDPTGNRIRTIKH